MTSRPSFDHGLAAAIIHNERVASTLPMGVIVLMAMLVSAVESTCSESGGAEPSCWIVGNEPSCCVEYGGTTPSATRTRGVKPRGELLVDRGPHLVMLRKRPAGVQRTKSHGTAPVVVVRMGCAAPDVLYGQSRWDVCWIRAGGANGVHVIVWTAQAATLAIVEQSGPHAHIRAARA